MNCMEQNTSSDLRLGLLKIPSAYVIKTIQNFLISPFPPILFSLTQQINYCI
jgi:hypothetical protein